jgi:hypothetical protein
MANDGTALGALNEIIENAGGTSDAQTLVPAIEDLGEIIGSGGGGGGGTIADGSITTKKLANGAVTNAKLATLGVGQDNIKQDAVGNHQLADDAVHTGNIMDGSVSSSKINASAKQELILGILYAADATTAQTLAALGFAATVLTPKDAYSTTDAYGTSIQMSTRSMLCWIDTASGYLEKAPLGFSGNLQSQAITLWAKGLHSTASGILGVDESWTITANA